MLVEVTDVKGRRHWINPMYVKAIKQDRRGNGIILGVQVSNFSAVITTAEPAQSLADRISAAMPESASWQALAAIETEEEARRRAAAAAAAAG